MTICIISKSAHPWPRSPYKTPRTRTGKDAAKTKASTNLFHFNWHISHDNLHQIAISPPLTPLSIAQSTFAGKTSADSDTHASTHLFDFNWHISHCNLHYITISPPLTSCPLHKIFFQTGIQQKHMQVPTFSTSIGTSLITICITSRSAHSWPPVHTIKWHC